MIAARKGRARDRWRHTTANDDRLHRVPPPRPRRSVLLWSSIDSPAIEQAGCLLLRKQLLDLMLPEIDQREGAAVGTGERGVEIEAEALVDRGDHFGRLDGPLGRVRAHRVALADGPPALDSAAGE